MLRLSWPNLSLWSLELYNGPSCSHLHTHSRVFPSKIVLNHRGGDRIPTLTSGAKEHPDTQDNGLIYLEQHKTTQHNDCVQPLWLRACGWWAFFSVMALKCRSENKRRLSVYPSVCPCFIFIPNKDSNLTKMCSHTWSPSINRPSRNTMTHRDRHKPSQWRVVTYPDVSGGDCTVSRWSSHQRHY